jgi:hypothetical protein
MFSASKIRIAQVVLGLTIATATIGWIVLAKRPEEPALRLEVENTIKSKPGLRLISEHSELMRTER